MALLLYVRQPITELNSGIAARETANHLGDLINAVRGICACTDDQNDQNVVIDNAKDVLDEAEQMMDCCKVLLSDPVSDVVQYGVCGGQYGFVGNNMSIIFSRLFPVIAWKKCNFHSHTTNDILLRKVLMQLRTSTSQTRQYPTRLTIC